MRSDERDALLPGRQSTRSEGQALAPTCYLSGGSEHGEDVQKAGRVQRRLVLALVLAGLFLVVEVVGGYIAHSLAILTDAAHLLSDVSGFVVALLASLYAYKESSNTHSFGYARVEVLGALASVLSTWLVTGILVFEAIDRVLHPQMVDGRLMFILACVGVAVNLAMWAILGGHHGHHHHHHDHAAHGHEEGGHGGEAGSRGCAGHCKPAVGGQGPGPAEHADAGLDLEAGRRPPKDAGDSVHSGDSEEQHGHAHGHDHDHRSGHGGPGTVGAAGPRGHAHTGEEQESNINVRGAVLHVVGDLIQSLGVALAGAILWLKQGQESWLIVDPLCTFLFAGIVVWTTLAILRDIWDILLERVPRAFDLPNISRQLAQTPGVCSVHDLHIWSLKPGADMLTAHLGVSPDADADEALHAALDVCKAAGIHHTTLQLHRGPEACRGPQCRQPA